MILDPNNVQKLENFLQRIYNDVYPEPETAGGRDTVQQVINYFLGKFPSALHGRILDVGCGQGTALKIFQDMGLQPTGITLDSDDIKICHENGLTVHRMDQSFLDFDESHFDFLWCRHCLEHSIFPLFTLSGFNRVLKAGGFFYIEVPAPDTACQHQTNRNHYSVLGKTMWLELIKRSGLVAVDFVELEVKTVGGLDDIYWGFIGQKPLS